MSCPVAIKRLLHIMPDYVARILMPANNPPLSKWLKNSKGAAVAAPL